MNFGGVMFDAFPNMLSDWHLLATFDLPANAILYSYVFGHFRAVIYLSYRELLDAGADRTEILSYLAQGDMVTTTIRIPENLKAAIAEEASLSGMSLSAYMRQCAIKRLVGSAGDD